ncbi:microtubule-associated protein tau isoform X2 [Sipha flava]|uniref:Microtubule-associated protein n=1 Tax=Sipha flava TaxID=143950 RepID=A0A8B8G5Z2_9HEMI|nr:microtubule-associated protein tau isoform X2 [Sipha flava]
MDNHRRNSIIEPSGGYGSDTRNPMNTTTLPPKPQQRAPTDFNPRPQRPEFYQQGQYNVPNRPLGPQQQRQPPHHQQQQQQSRTTDDKVNSWNLNRQGIPQDVVRGPTPSQQRPPSQSQYYNMQQRPPPPPQEQQQYRQQPPSLVQDRRSLQTRVEEKQPFRPENGRPARPVVGSGIDDDEEVVVNSSVNQQPPPPPLNRRDSTLHAGGRPPEGVEPNRQWQRLAAAATAQGAGKYGKPQQDQQYGRQQPSLVMPEGQEQQRYNRQQFQQDEDIRRPSLSNSQKPRDVPSIIRRDSVMDGISKVADVSLRGRNDAPVEYGRRPPPVDMQDDRKAAVEQEAARRLVPQDSQDEIRRQVEYRKAEVVNEFGSGGSNGKLVAPRPDMNKEDRSTKEYEEQQQSRYERKVEKEFAGPKAVEHGNRASELRKSHFEATHMKPVKEPQKYSMVDGGGDNIDKTFGKELPTKVEEMGNKTRDYAAIAASRPAGEHDTNDRNKTKTKTIADNVRNRDEPIVSQSKNLRPDTLKIIKDIEPLKDSSNSKGNHRGENDVGKSPSKIPKKDRSELKTPTRAITPKSPENANSIGQKKLPMNKVQVGSAPSPNLKVVRSKIGSLQNTSHKPGGGQVKIENRKLEWKAGTRIEAKNDTYVPGGGDKKIPSVKLQWNAKPKVGSLENKTHKPGGGDKKIETVKLDFKDKAKPKIGSKDNIKHTPGGGAVKIEDQKMEIKAQSKVGSWDNVKHRPGGGEVKIFDDKSYIKQTTGQIGTPTKSQLRRSSSLKSPINMKLFSPEERTKSQVKIVVTPTSEENLYTKIGMETNKAGFRRSAYNRSPSLQNNMVIPEEAVRSNN